MKRDLFPDTTRDETPAADVHHRQSSTGRTPDRQGEERITPVGAGRDAVLDTRARCCGTCGHGKKTRVDFVRCGLRLWRLNAPGVACELEPVAWVPMDDGKAAKREAQAGIDSAVAAADRSVEGWSDTAYAFLELYCATNKGKRCIGHDIVNASVERGVIQPGNTKAWGGPIQRAARMGLLKRIGYDEDPNRHGNPVPLWEVA